MSSKNKNFTSVTTSCPKVRDMRQEAMDMGSHGAKDYFTEPGVSRK